MTDLLKLEEIMPAPDFRQDLVARELTPVVRVARCIARCYSDAELDILI